EQHGSSKCSPCNKNEYIEYPNDFAKCLGCQICREDQVELSPCQKARNTQCACRNGTFCSPDHPCEMCQKCRPRCAKGEVELAPCTPYRDRRCGLPAGTPSSSSGDTMLIVGVVVSPIILILVSCVLWKYCCQQSAGDRTGVGSKPRTAVVSSWGGPGTQDNILNEQLSQDQLPLRASGVETSSSPGPEVHGGPNGCSRTLSFQAKPRNNLVPVPGKDPVNLLQRSFDIFAEVVPSAEWRRYGRALDLLENDIDIAMKNDKGSRESFFQMLKMWHNKKGMNASVNTLLDTLQEMNLAGVAQDVSTRLVKQELFQYE
ncbi:Tumor necrosis factor receptor superfamily member 10B, partial [Merops nubicus]